MKSTGRLYLDSSYLAKWYVNEPDSGLVRQLILGADEFFSSAWCVVEMACIFQRKSREGSLEKTFVALLWDLFREHLSSGRWTLLPISDGLAQQTAEFVQTLPSDVFLRAGDAIHLISARAAGFTEIWSSDRHLLRAAPHFGLKGRSVGR